jgi:release factor glutamine methyltransferase
VGHREFYSLDFSITADVLIPRPETEFVVLTLLDAVREYAAADGGLQIADVGTGSGALAVCAAKHIERCRVTATDISGAALKVARRNAATHGVEDRIELISSDLLGSVPEDRRFDFVVSNPPYVSEGELAQLAPEVRDYEPRNALVAGVTGDEVITRLIPQAGDRLTVGGSLILEISPMLEQRVHELLRQDGRYDGPATHKDLAGLARVVSARRNDA